MNQSNFIDMMKKDKQCQKRAKTKIKIKIKKGFKIKKIN